MIESIIDFDYRIILAVNGLHTPFLDAAMHFLSASNVWIPLYALIAAALFIPSFYGKNSKMSKFSSTRGWIIGIAGVCAVLLCFGLTDQISVLIKNSVRRLRPGHDPNLAGMLYLFDGKGGLYGFVSSHAANTFGLALITALIFRRKLYSAFIFLWAGLVSFSRIYLARHFLTDILCGALTGLTIAAAIYFLLLYILKSTDKRRKQKCSAT